MKSAIAAFGAGLVFAVGLGVSGMTLPAKVIGFLDIFGDWDPSLAFVMAGAIGVHALASRWIRSKSGGRDPVAASQPARSIDLPLVKGAALFGLGWGLVGYCPGPALVGLVTLETPVVLFTAAMLAGMFVFHYQRRK